MSSSKSFFSTDVIINYATEHSLRPTEVQKSLQEETLKHAGRRMMGAPEVLQLMANLMKTTGARKVLDIGVFTGSSSLSAALALPPDGEVHGLDVSEEFVSVGRPFFAKAGVADKIKIHIAPALDTLDQFIKEGKSKTFDFAFIDADKGNYTNYYERCLQLIRKGGIVAVDNTLWNGKVADPSDTSPDTVAIRAFNDHVKGDTRVDISFITMGDGLTLLFVK